MATHTGTSPQAAGGNRVSQAWTEENDNQLMRARTQGMNWQPIASQYFPDKTANACRKRHERLMEKRNNDHNWEGVKMDQLARAYYEVREQMWKLLGDRVGEKWQTVEAKCMEKGLKTLHTASRTAERREGRSNVSYDSRGGSEITDTHYPPSRQSGHRDRSGSHHDDERPSFNDSGLGHSFNREDHPFSTPNQNDHPPFGGLTPPYTASHSSSTGMTPIVTASPPFPPIQPQSSPYQHHQPLPSFSTILSQSSISGVIHPPVTTH